MGRVKRARPPFPEPLLVDGFARVAFDNDGKWVFLDWEAGEENMRAVGEMSESMAEELADTADQIREALDFLWANEVRVFLGAPDEVGERRGRPVGGEAVEDVEYEVVEEEEEEGGPVTVRRIRLGELDR